MRQLGNTEFFYKSVKIQLSLKIVVKTGVFGSDIIPVIPFFRVC